MPLPSPDTYDRAIRELERETRRLVSAALRSRGEYRWAYFAGLQPSRGSDEGRTGGRSAPIHESNPTLGVVSDAAKRRLRHSVTRMMKALDEATEAVRRETKQIESRHAGLRRAFGDNEIRGSEKGRFPKSVNDAELAVLERRKRERVAGGEGWGEG